MADPVIETPLSSGTTDHPDALQQGDVARNEASAQGSGYPITHIDLSAGLVPKQDVDLSAGMVPSASGQPQGSAMERMGQSFAAGAGETLAGLGKLGSKIPGVSQLAEKTGDVLGLTKLPADVDPYKTVQEGIKPAVQKAISQDVKVPMLGIPLGYGGETMTEFVMGDEALKGLSLAEKLTTGGKIAKVLESSPRIMQAVKIGAEAMRHGIIQAAQTEAKTGGDTGQAVKEGAEMGATSGILGGAFGAISGALNKAGTAAKAVEAGSQVAKNAPGAVEVGQKVASAIDDARQTMHSDFDAGIQKLTGDLGLKNATIPFEKSPLQKAAEDAATAKEEGKGVLGSEFKQISGGSNESRNLLNALTDPDKKGDLTIDELVNRRQQLTEKIRQLTKGATSSADRADVQVYGKLLGGIDDTIGQMAKESGNEGAAQDYEALRGAYKQKVNLFKEPVIKALETGKLDEAANNFLSGGKVVDKTNTLEQVLGKDGLKSFGQDVFSRIAADSSSESGQINPAKFAKNFKKIDSLPPEVKDRLFDSQMAGQGLDALSKDLKSAANYQRLVRGGLLGGAGSLVSGWGLMLGLLGHADMPKATAALDYFANHPAMWKTLGAVSKAGEAAAPVARIVGPAIKQQVGQAAIKSLANVYGGAAAPLSQEQQ